MQKTVDWLNGCTEGIFGYFEPLFVGKETPVCWEIFLFGMAVCCGSKRSRWLCPFSPCTPAAIRGRVSTWSRARREVKRLFSLNSIQISLAVHQARK